MKILWITHGKVNFEVEIHFYETMLEMGIDVERINYLEFMNMHGKEALNKHIIHVAAMEQPDIAFSIFHRDEIDYSTFAELRSLGIKTVNWFCDDHWRFHEYTHKWLPYLDYAVTTAHVALPWYKEEGYKNVIHSQWGANPKYFYPDDAVEKDIDVSFVGQCYGVRSDYIEALKNANINVQVFGKGWNHAKEGIPLEEMVNIFRRSKICLNISESSRGKYLQLKARDFEVPATRGGLLLTGKVDGIEDYYRIGEEIDVYFGFNSLISKVNFYLNNPVVREKMVNRAWARVLGQHTMAHRLKGVFTRMGYEI